MTTNCPLFLSESQVKELLSWPTVYHAVEQALLSVSSLSDDKDLPSSSQPARSLTSLPDSSGILFTMPGYIGNYSLPLSISSKPKRNVSTLACKLVTSFTNNDKLPVPLPNVLATICLFDTITGRLKCVLGGTEITAWRTAAASLVATQHLYVDRPNVRKEDGFYLAIVGCGVQGRIHAIGMCTMFNVVRLNLWNRTKIRAENLKIELEDMRSLFANQMVEIQVCDAVADATLTADVIVTATFTKVPILMFDAVKKNVHINAVGAGASHHSELEDLVYANSSIYVDSWVGAKSELKTLGHEIKGEIGELLIGKKLASFEKCTIFHSMGMAVEDCTVAELVFERHQNKNNN